MPKDGMRIGSFGSYAEAQRAVDYLSDNKFPVENTSIIGSDLRMVEQITGRLTWARAALAGAASGAWFGLFVGLLLGLFAPGGRELFTLVLFGLLFGLAVGIGLVALRSDTRPGAAIAADLRANLRGEPVREK